MSLDYGKKQENMEETPEAEGEHTPYTHKTEASTDKKTIRIVNVVDRNIYKIIHTLYPMGGASESDAMYLCEVQINLVLMLPEQEVEWTNECKVLALTPGLR